MYRRYAAAVQGGGALLVRLYIMLRDQIDYAEFRRRGQPRRLPQPQGEALVKA